jgi:multidrug efflux pump subunit AcrA (membrane-fusion protein)
VDVGDFVAAGSPVASMFAIDVAQVRIPLTDADLAVLGVTPGFVSADAVNGPAAILSAVVGGERHEWTGRLTQIEAAVDARTRLIYGLVTVSDPFGASNAAPLAPGTFVEVRLDGLRSEKLVALPRAALKKNQFIYVVGEDMALETREVTPVTADATTLYLRGGIAAGERVVVSYIPNPRDGMKVRDVRAPEPAKEKTVAEKADKKSGKTDDKKKK